MPRLRMDLDLIRAYIISWMRAYYITEEIAQNIETTFGWTVSERTIYQRLQFWDIRRYIIAQDMPNLYTQIAILFRISYTDNEIVIKF
jgi:DNA-binding PadR family transcriptional regulator